MTTDSLHIFQGGPQHNEIRTTADLLYGRGDGASAAWITGYEWTQDTITGSESGRVARVWRYLDAPE